MPDDSSMDWDEGYDTGPDRWSPYPGSDLARRLYVVRLRQKPLAISRCINGRWVRGCATVADRARSVARELPRPLRFNEHGQRRWQPTSGRESPREELMEDRRFSNAYSYPGCVGAKRKMLDAEARRRFERWGTMEPYPPMYAVQIRAALRKAA